MLKLTGEVRKKYWQKNYKNIFFPKILGLGGDNGSTINGNAGAKLACGIVVSNNN